MHIKTPSLCGCLDLCIELSSDTQGYISYTNPTISYSRAGIAWLYCFVAVPTLISYPWRIDDAPLGHQKAFYLNPIDYLKE